MAVLDLIRNPYGSSGKEPSCNAETQETRFRSLGREDPMEAEMATHSSILAWKTSRSQRVGHNRVAEGTHAQQPRHVLQEAGSGNPIENVLNLPPKRISRLQFFMH